MKIENIIWPLIFVSIYFSISTILAISNIITNQEPKITLCVDSIQYKTIGNTIMIDYNADGTVKLCSIEG